MKNYEKSITIAASIATIIALCVSVVALIPSFGQWLIPAKVPTNVTEISMSPPPTLTSTSPPVETPSGSSTAQSIPSNTSIPENTATTSPTSTLIFPLITPTDVPTLTLIQFDVQSTFDNLRTDGWTIDSGKLNNPGAGGSGGGLDNGCLVWSGGSDGRTNYFIAPTKYHGDWQSYTELRLDLWSRGGKYFTSGLGMHSDIYIVSGFATAQHPLPYRPPEQWETFVIPLIEDGEWVFGGGAKTLNDVLVNVTDFQIRSEYGDGSDTTGLDNVKLTPRLQE